jgi:MFS transporter, SP family, arabinose:H+ symporter
MPSTNLEMMQSDFKVYYVYLISAIAALGGLMFGFDSAIISGAGTFIKSYFALNDLQFGWAISSLLVGCLIGASFAGRMSDLYGRKFILLGVALFFAVSCFVTGVTSSFTVFILARIVGGIAVGAASLLSPLYIAEIAPYHLRGKLVSLNQLSITLGILISYLINYLLRDIGDNNWRWMLASGIFPSLLFFAALFVVPESPRWLVHQGKEKKALGILKRIGGETNALKEMKIIQSAQFEEKGKLSGLFKGQYKKVLWVGIILAIFVQITGINTVIYYAPVIFLKSGNSIDSALINTFLIGIINFLFTFVAVFTVDKFGRKPLYIAGSIGMTVSLIALSLSFITGRSGGLLGLISILIFIASFAACIGPVFWVLMSEIFPGKLRGTIMSVAVFTVWITNFLVSQFFPYVLENFGGAVTFGFLAIMSFLMIVYTSIYVPETKGKTLEEIELFWEKQFLIKK